MNEHPVEAAESTPAGLPDNLPAPRKFQFTLYRLLKWVTLLAVFLALLQIVHFDAALVTAILGYSAINGVTYLFKDPNQSENFLLKSKLFRVFYLLGSLSMFYMALFFCRRGIFNRTIGKGTVMRRSTRAPR